MMKSLIARWTGRARPRAMKSLTWSTAPFWLYDGQRRGSTALNDYRSLAERGYVTNPVAFRCVRMIADAAASVPFLLYSGAEEIADHPLKERLERPNPYVDGISFFEGLYSHLQLAGTAYIEAIGEEDVAALYLLRPDRVAPVLSAEGWPIAYRYRAGTGERLLSQGTRAHAPLLVLSLFHPSDDHAGLSPVEAASAALAVHNASTDWSRALLENVARPSGALVYKNDSGSHLTAEQFERLKTELEASYSGAGNAGRPMLLEGGLDWKALSLSPHDMDFLNAKHSSAREIALAFGVPPMLLGIPGDNTYSNYREANLALWRQVVMPLAEKVARALGAWLTPRYGPGLRLVCDFDAVAALAIEREAVWKRLSEASFLTDAEKREAAGYPPEPEHGAGPAMSRVRSLRGSVPR